MRSDYISMPEAARKLGIDTKTLIAWLDSEGVEYLRIQIGQSAKSRCRIRNDILDGFIEKHTVRHQPKQAGRPRVVGIR